MVFIQPISCFHKSASYQTTEYNYVVTKPDGNVGVCSKQELSSLTGGIPTKILPELKVTPKVMREMIEQYMYLRYFISPRLRTSYNISKKEKEHNIV